MVLAGIVGIVSGSSLHSSTTIAHNCTHGEFLVLKKDEYVGRSLLELGEWSENEFLEIYSKFIKEGDIVLDIGANIGVFTVPFAKLVGSLGVVHAFEPVRVIFNLMVANVVLNGHHNVIAHRSAVGERKSFVKVPHLWMLDDLDEDVNFGGQGMDHFLANARTLSEHPNQLDTVPIIAIDDLKLSGCNFIKIDIEGHELGALKGAKRTINKFKPAIYVEVERTPTRIKNAQAVIDLLTEYEYDCFGHHPPMNRHSNTECDSNTEECEVRGKNWGKGVVSENALCVHRSKLPKSKST